MNGETGAETRQQGGEHNGATVAKAAPAASSGSRRGVWVLVAVGAAALLVAGVGVGVAVRPGPEPAATAEPAVTAEAAPEQPLTPAPPGLNGVPAHVPELVETGDPRNLDPCRLLDPDTVDRLGTNTYVDPGPSMSGCTAWTPDTKDLGHVEIAFQDATSSDTQYPVRGAPVSLGGVQVQQHEGIGDFCVDEVRISDRTAAQVTGHRSTTQPDPCRLADTVVVGAVQQLARNGLPYDSTRLSRLRVASIDPCFPAASRAALARALPGLDVGTVERDMTAGKCTLGDLSGGRPEMTLKWQVVPAIAFDDPSELVTVGRRPLRMVDDHYGDGGSLCVGRLLVKKDSQIAPDSAEVLSVTAHGARGSTGICDRLYSSMKVVEPTLPPTL
ncbi:hypothetical protein [Pseudonocardia phyllosphaerae]|uniref:hypothetical protein n=1 Tax=Pseudonocardia phyllosphaerae TaxID=3390502 RepID=UPI00397AFD32